MTRTSIRYLLAAIFLAGGLWLLLNGKQEFSRTIQLAYHIDFWSSLKLVLVVANVQFILAILWVVPRGMTFARWLSITFLLLGAAHIGYILTHQPHLACGCTAKANSLPTKAFNILSLCKNVILIGLCLVARARS